MSALRLVALAIAILPLGACAIVAVQADGGRPELSAWPLGVKVARGSADAIGVRQWSAGFWGSCYAAGLGVSSSFCVVIDAKTCTAVIMDGGHDSRPAKGILAKIVHLAEVDCLGRNEESSK